MWLRQQQQSQRAIPDIPLPGRACQQGDPEGIPRLECVERPQHVVAVLPGLEPTGHTQKSWGLPGSILIKYLVSTWASCLWQWRIPAMVWPLSFEASQRSVDGWHRLNSKSLPEKVRVRPETTAIWSINYNNVSFPMGTAKGSAGLRKYYNTLIFCWIIASLKWY